METTNKSIYENVNDKILFKIIHMIAQSHDFNSIKSSSDKMFIDELSLVSKYFDLKNVDVIDDDYVYNVWKLNLNMIDNNRLTKTLERPTFRQFEYISVVYETHWVKEHYKNTIGSYSDNNSDIIDIIKDLTNEGLISAYDGDREYTEIYDSETTDEKLDNNSIKEIS